VAKQDQRKVAVIGAGWAGCAAALTLQERGMQVSLFEASRTAGGRARRIEHDGHVLDNGQHILLGAYQQTLRLIRQVGFDPDTALLRLPLQMPYPAGSGMSFIASPLPAPLHLLWALLRCRGLSLADKLAMARFSSTARWMGWQLNIDCSVTELLERFEQTPRLIQLLWRPLCLAALNTSPDRASAKVFLAVLRDSLGGRRQASDMLLPRCDLSALFPEPALQHLQAQGAQVHLGRRISSVSPSTKVDANPNANVNTWQLCSEQSEPEHFNALVVATDPLQASRLLGSFAPPEMAHFSYEAITTCYLQYAPQLRLDRPFFALLDDPAQQHWGQFVFDRGALNASQSGLLAVVVSASTAALELGHEALANALCIQLADVLKMPQLAAPNWRFVVSEKRATFACTPGLLRPSCTTPHAGLALAGDYTAGDYPATLEGAVRSGMQAALSLCSD
jgi:squalene-associated FAD-dependent desaturase